MAVKRTSAPLATKARCAARRVWGEAMRRWADQRGVRGEKVMLKGGDSRVVPRPPSSRRRGVGGIDGSHGNELGVTLRSFGIDHIFLGFLGFLFRILV